MYIDINNIWKQAPTDLVGCVVVVHVAVGPLRRGELAEAGAGVRRPARGARPRLRRGVALP